MGVSLEGGWDNFQRCHLGNSAEFQTTHTFTYFHYPWTLHSHPSLGNIVLAVSFVLLEMYLLSCVSKESSYLMLTSWDLACKQTWSQMLWLKITTRSHGWVKEETERKEGRCRERKEKNELWGQGMRWSQCTVGAELKNLDRRSNCCSGQSMCVSWGGLEAWYSKLKIPIKNKPHGSHLLLSFSSPFLPLSHSVSLLPVMNHI